MVSWRLWAALSLLSLLSIMLFWEIQIFNFPVFHNRRVFWDQIEAPDSFKAQFVRRKCLLSLLSLYLFLLNPRIWQLLASSMYILMVSILLSFGILGSPKWRNIIYNFFFIWEPPGAPHRGCKSWGTEVVPNSSGHNSALVLPKEPSEILFDSH